MTVKTQNLCATFLTNRNADSACHFPDANYAQANTSFILINTAICYHAARFAAAAELQSAH